MNKHRIFENLTDIMGIPDVAVDKYDARMNKWNKEPKEFMLAAEKSA